MTLEGFAEVSASKLFAAIQNARHVTLARLLVGLSIPQVGEETAVLLANRFRTLDSLSKASEDELTKIQGIGPVVAKEVSNWFSEKRHKELLAELKKVLIIASPPRESKKISTLSGKTVVLTGTLGSMSREEAKEKLRIVGADVSSSVSKETDYVVAGENPGSKYDNAQKLGVPILSESEFLKMMQ